MNVADLQKFVESLGTLFASRQGKPQTDMAALGEALAPFRELSLPAFTTFLQQAKEYKETGILPAGKQRKPRTSGQARTPKTPKAPLKTRNDAAAIQEAVDELERLYSHAADPDLTYATIESTVKHIHDSFDQNGLKEVAKGFNLSSGLKSKKACRDKIEQKIKERKARNERGEVIATAARAGAPARATGDANREDEVYQATVVE